MKTAIRYRWQLKLTTITNFACFPLVLLFCNVDYGLLPGNQYKFHFLHYYHFPNHFSKCVSLF